ncbi:MAG TPA: Clp protease N-terminal domain-containing protein [Amycolatopsis sp.]|uniref:Clp protease N-terminal domain-containing protein n=1 Tax=Amycolatopsis sp. TaxID=37632 RepID=UPI002B4A9708|nr:Clp protease N-terminal domain-containing protein [Amycolatopsis sp.]HKS48422.1 Clp protease N-terminal domain-containing protein [Amycolatopsis sp.]
MFERFTQDARAVVVEASRDANELDASEITPLHLLAALLRFPGSGAARVLAELGVSLDDLAAEAGRVRRRGGITEADAAALEEFGIDVDRIIERIEQTHGPNALAGNQGRFPKRRHVPFADESKKTLQLCLKEIIDMGGRRHLGSEHILLALAVQRGPAADVLARFDVDANRLRQVLSGH